MDEQEVVEGLENEGFITVAVHADAPETVHADHTHERKTTHIVLDGSMTVVMQGTSVEYRAGDRFDVPAGMVHSAMVGQDGCRYVFAE
jgi:quercetin dioxygenase-like cupin family protein